MSANPVTAAVAANARAHKSGDPDAILASRRELAAARLTAFAEKLAAEAPALTDDQIAVVTAALRGGA